jgi:hypothetical protein
MIFSWMLAYFDATNRICSNFFHAPPNAWPTQVVNKDTLKKPRHKAKLESEIKIHMKLKHPHVVYLHDAFEDKDNVYLLMELCEAQTLLELVKRKKRLADCVRFNMISAHRYMRLIDCNAIFI